MLNELKLLQRKLLKLVNKGYIDLLTAQRRVPLPLREKRHQPRLLVLQASAPKVPPGLEVPAVVAARPVREVRDVHLQLRVDGGPERGHALERVEEARLDFFVVGGDPGHGAVEVGVELVHCDGEDVVSIVAVACSLLYEAMSYERVKIQHTAD